MIEQITNVVSNVGFPIACCIIMMVYYHKSVEELKTTVTALNESIHELNGKIDALIGGRRSTDDKRN